MPSIKLPYQKFVRISYEDFNGNYKEAIINTDYIVSVIPIKRAIMLSNNFYGSYGKAVIVSKESMERLVDLL